MPVIIFILLVVLVAQIGFWKTLASVLGAIGVIILLFAVLGLLVWALIAYFFSRTPRRF